MQKLTTKKGGGAKMKILVLMTKLNQNLFTYSVGPQKYFVTVGSRYIVSSRGQWISTIYRHVKILSDFYLIHIYVCVCVCKLVKRSDIIAGHIFAVSWARNQTFPIKDRLWTTEIELRLLRYFSFPNSLTLFNINNLRFTCIT